VQAKLLQNFIAKGIRKIKRWGVDFGVDFGIDK